MLILVNDQINLKAGTKFPSVSSLLLSFIWCLSCCLALYSRQFLGRLRWDWARQVGTKVQGRIRELVLRGTVDGGKSMVSEILWLKPSHRKSNKGRLRKKTDGVKLGVLRGKALQVKR